MSLKKRLQLYPITPPIAFSHIKGNGANQLAIIIPCHRVITSNDDLRGYAGELWRKKRLLHHEKQARG